MSTNIALSFRAKLTLCDADNNCVEFIDANVEWPLQSDGFAVFKFPYSNDDVSKYEQLDEWESSQAELNVSFELIECWDFPGGIPRQVECPQELKDYNEISGTGKIIDLRVKAVDENGNTIYGGWRYQPFGTIEVPIYFSEYE